MLIGLSIKVVVSMVTQRSSLVSMVTQRSSLGYTTNTLFLFRVHDGESSESRVLYHDSILASRLGVG